MNASSIFKQLMEQGSGELGLKGVLDEPTPGPRGPRPNRTQSPRPRAGFDTRSALGGGAMALLMGSRPGRKLTGKALKYGIVASIGMYAWNAWQSSELRNGPSAGADAEWDRDQARTASGEHIDSLSSEHQEQRSRTLLQAMILTARATGQSEEQTRTRVTQKMSDLGADDELYAWVEKQLSAPLEASVLAEQADSPQAAREILLVSLAVAGERHEMESDWIEQLVDALGLDRETVIRLKRKAAQAG
ncbi:tellurite resistance TerB family protein [Halomonas sp. PAMB 3232]|uniref:tellurite resistance TerB family protein n=1 Tax=Halomonas sp. PAMB 3232 TaxID=3075221 RepID=UPI00289E44A4|nr:tellurite resistance TerB family protein [Halomonas sp. PAMB 3232]WNL39889.1 tellurite resistance TerB family protein [Halomonas sp. PAMB 3232]